MRARSIVTSMGTCLAALALTLPTVASGATVSAQSGNPYERGPDPTEQSVRAATGPFATDQISVPSTVSGFGGGTVYYPTDTSQTFGAVAASPGFVESETAVAWFGPRLASHGFVVITINTNGLFDFPGSRADQLMAALDHLTGPSPVSDRVDPDRLAVMGHSMGGGGTLEAARDNPELQAAVPLAPWDLVLFGFGGVQVPTMVVGCENDLVAAVGSHAEPFYEQIPASTEKAYLEIAGQGHFCTNSTNTTIGTYVLSWLKRFVDDDTRYEQFLCPPPSSSWDISEYRDTCPH